MHSAQASGAHTVFCFRRAVRTLAERRRQEMDFFLLFFGFWFHSPRLWMAFMWCMHVASRRHQFFSFIALLPVAHTLLCDRIAPFRFDWLFVCEDCDRNASCSGEQIHRHLWADISRVNDVISQSNSHLVQVSLNETGRNGRTAHTLPQFASSASDEQVDNLEFLWDSAFGLGDVLWCVSSCALAHFSRAHSRAHKQLNRNKFMRLSHSRLNLLKWNFAASARNTPDFTQLQLLNISYIRGSWMGRGVRPHQP